MIKGSCVGGGGSKTLRRNTWVGSAGSDEVTESEGERGGWKREVESKQNGSNVTCFQR